MTEARKVYTVDDLYTLSETLTQAGGDVAKHEDKYNSLISAVQEDQDSAVRTLASQLIARYFKHFPSRAEDAFESIVPLCENVDVDIRKRANMALVSICRENKDFAPRLAEILVQLFQSNEQSELNLVNSSLMILLNLDIKNFLQSFFACFARCEYPQNDDETETLRVKSVRERALKFLTARLPAIPTNLITKEIEELILESSRKIMDHEVNREEFIMFISLLTKLKIAKTVQGQGTILEAISAKAFLDEEFDPSDADLIDGLLLCARHAIPLFSLYNRSSRYVQYICHKVLAHLDTLAISSNELPILQVLAEMSPFLTTTDEPPVIDLSSCQSLVFNKMLEYMPLPQQSQPTEQTESTKETSVTDGEAPAAAESNNNNEESKFKLAQIEYIMYIFQQLGRLNPNFFDSLKVSGDSSQSSPSADVLRDMRVKLQHLALYCQKHADKLNSQLVGVSEQDMKKEENATRQTELRRSKNITLMVRDLFKNPPQFKAQILLSCKPAPATRPQSSPTIPVSFTPPNKDNVKRLNNMPVRNNPDPKRQRVDQTLFQARQARFGKTNEQLQKVYRNNR